MTSVKSIYTYIHVLIFLLISACNGLITFKTPSIPPIEHYQPSTSRCPLTFSPPIVVKDHNKGEVKCEYVSEVIPGYTCNIIIKSIPDGEEEGGCIMFVDHTIVGGVTRRMSSRSTTTTSSSSSSDVVEKTALGAVKWVKKDFKKWCRTYTPPPSPPPISPSDVIDRALHSTFSNRDGVKSDLDDVITEIKSEGKGLDDYFNAGMSRSEGMVKRGEASRGVAVVGGATVKGGKGGVDIFKDYGDEGQGKSEWEVTRENVEWALEVVKGLKDKPDEEGEDEVPRNNMGLEILFSSSSENASSSYYHSGRLVPPSVLDGLRSVIITGVKLGVIENPKREFEMRSRFDRMMSDVENSLRGGGRAREEMEEYKDVLVWEGYGDCVKGVIDGFREEDEEERWTVEALEVVNEKAKKVYSELQDMIEMKDVQYMTILRDVVKAGQDGEEGREGERMRAMISNANVGDEWLGWLMDKIKTEQEEGGESSEWCMVLKLVKAATTEEFSGRIRHLTDCLGYALRYDDDVGRGKYLMAVMKDLGEKDRKEFAGICENVKIAARGGGEFKKLRDKVERVAWCQEFIILNEQKVIEGRKRRELEGGREG